MNCFERLENPLALLRAQSETFLTTANVAFNIYLMIYIRKDFSRTRILFNGIARGLNTKRGKIIIFQFAFVYFPEMREESERARDLRKRKISCIILFIFGSLFLSRNKSIYQ